MTTRRPARAGEQTEDEAARRPARPVLVEIAAASMVVTGLMSTIVSIDLLGRIGDSTPGIEPLAILSVSLGLATTLLGVLVRFGYGWLVALNVQAIAAFLEFTSGSLAGILTGAVDIVVVLALLWTRPWFAWSPDRDDEEGDGGA